MHYNGQKWVNFKSHVQGVKWQNQTEQRAFSHLFNGTTKISTSITKSWSEVTPLPIYFKNVQWCMRTNGQFDYSCCYWLMPTICVWCVPIIFYVFFLRDQWSWRWTFNEPSKYHTTQFITLINYKISSFNHLCNLPEAHNLWHGLDC